MCGIWLNISLTCFSTLAPVISTYWFYAAWPCPESPSYWEKCIIHYICAPKSLRRDIGLRGLLDKSTFGQWHVTIISFCSPVILMRIHDTTNNWKVIPVCAPADGRCTSAQFFTWCMCTIACPRMLLILTRSADFRPVSLPWPSVVAFLEPLTGDWHFGPH